MATEFGRKNPWFEYNALLGSKVMHGSVRVNQRSICLEMSWLPNLVGRIPYESICITGVKGHAGVSQSQPEVKLLGNA